MEYEAITEGASGAPEDLDIYASANPSANIGTMYKSVESDSVTNKQNKDAVEAELLTEKPVILLNIWMWKQVLVLNEIKIRI